MFNTMLLLVCLVLELVACVHAKPKHVTINLEAKWNSTPLILETSEYLAKENNDYFWSFVHSNSKVDLEMLSEESDESHYHDIQRHATKSLSPLQLSLLKFSLSLREYSPTVQMFQQLAAGEGASDKCVSFVNVHGSIACDMNKIKKLIKSAGDRGRTMLYQFDHMYPGSSNADVVVILYGHIGSRSFNALFQELAVLAEKKEIAFVVRHYQHKTSEKKLRLSGYGVELALKSTEYKAKDDTKVEDDKSKGTDEELDDEVGGFVFPKLKELHPDKLESLKSFRKHLIDTATELSPLKVWELQDLSFQAAQTILNANSTECLKQLTFISQNFPTEARSLAQVNVQNDMKAEVKKNQQYFETYHQLTAGDSALYLNGLSLDMEVYDAFTMLDIMRSEARVMEGLHSFGFKGQEMKKLLLMDTSSESTEKYALDIRHSAIVYINDLENDKKYKNWPRNIQELLRPTFPGMLRHIAKNMFHMVLIVDPIDKESQELIKTTEAFLVHNAPFRIAVIFAVNFDPAVDGKTDSGVALTRAYNYLMQEEKPSKALSFITDVYELEEEIKPSLIIKLFEENYPDADKEMVFGADNEYNTMRKAAAAFLQQSGLGEFPQVLINGVALSRKHLKPSTFEEGIVSEVLDATTQMQSDVYQGHINDHMNILDFIMDKDNVMPRLNSRVLSAPALTLDFTDDMESGVHDRPDMYRLLNSREMTAALEGNMKYLTRKGENSKDDGYVKHLTLWVVANPDTPQGRDLVYSALKYMKSSHEVRLGIVFNPSMKESLISKAIYTAIRTQSGSIAKNFITKLVKEENAEGLYTSKKKLADLEVHGMDLRGYLRAVADENGDFLRTHKLFVEGVLNFKNDERAIIANGKVIGPFGDKEEFLPDDFSLLEKYTIQNSAKKIKSQLKSLKINGDKASNLVMKLSALLAVRSAAGTKQSAETRREINYSSEQHSVIKLPADPNSPSYYIEAIIDPVSREAQKLGPILMVLREIANVDVKIFMNSKDKLSEMPLKSYYRFVLHKEIQFKEGTLVSGPMARFEELPHKSILTLNMDAPEGWMLEAVRSPYDLDNLLLEEVKTGVYADYELENLLLEGHCHDSGTGQPPRGLQFTLGPNQTSVVQDTIVMANLGYFQLKAKPGVWFLQLREGRSVEIYDITSHERTDSPKGSKDVIIALTSFKSKIIRVKVSKKAGKDKEELLKDDDEDKGLWDSISSSFTGKKEDSDKDETLNIFSVASGHLYERLMRIMMLSVLKNTETPVKFWFLKNYLSPTFTDFLSYMSEEYNFKYQLVQYKWPRWLNQQKEKQRVIWGYKILFLDVLFPLDVKKFIFVDADQIVRADLQELVDLDLGGAPYGYTPFCDSRKEMDGFRFWKSGYWASHLAGRKYHISALYVVDLKKFRRIAAGDRLRGQYQGLSHDPNSLSNLDQDLPNNMIHQVNIKSLPQEWLYCETWCDQKDLPKAKTIDLCNNPLTKEPKLKAAMRIAPEWKDYDYEIKVLWDKVYGTNTRFQTEYEVAEDKLEEIDNKFRHHDEL